MAEDSRPFAMQLDVELFDRLSEPVRERKAKSVSAIIRTALERFDLEDAVIDRPAQMMISVRLPDEIRQDLKRVARKKQTSVGQLVRAAVDAFLPDLETDSMGQLEMEMPTSITAEEPVADVAPKPRGKSARKKPTTKVTLPPKPVRAARPQAKKTSPKAAPAVGPAVKKKAKR